MFFFFFFYRVLSSVWGVTGTPAIATVVFGVGAALASMFISLTVLVEMMSIGKCNDVMDTEVHINILLKEI